MLLFVYISKILYYNTILTALGKYSNFQKTIIRISSSSFKFSNKDNLSTIYSKSETGYVYMTDSKMH